MIVFNFVRRMENTRQKAPADEDAETYANDVASEIEKNIQDVRRSLISKHDTQNSNTIHTQASASAMKFQEEGLDKLAKAESKVEAEADDEGLKLEPAPGQNDEPVTIRNPEDYMDEIEATTDFIGSHSYENDIKELLGEIDESENKVKSLNVRVVENRTFSIVYSSVKACCRTIFQRTKLRSII